MTLTQLTKWIERSFPTDLAVESHPSLRSRLRGAPARLEEATRGLSPDELVRSDGRTWSIQTNAGHLVDLEPLTLRRVEEFLAGAETLSAWDGKNVATEEAHHDESSLEDILAAFRAIRGSLLERLDPLEARDFARTAYHPRLEQAMRLIDLMGMMAEHDDHHLARIHELRASRSL